MGESLLRELLAQLTYSDLQFDGFSLNFSQAGLQCRELGSGVS